MNRAERMAAGRETRGRNLRWMASAAMIAVAVIVGASVTAVSAGLIEAGPFQEGSTDLLLVSIAAHLLLAAAVAVHPGPRRISLFAAALAAMHWLWVALFTVGAALPALGWALHSGLRRPGQRSGWRRWAVPPPLPVALIIAICGVAAATLP